MNKFLLMLLVSQAIVFAQWEKLENYNYGETGIIFSSNDTIFAASGSKINFSLDNGLNWETFGNLDNEISFITTLTKYDNILFAGTISKGVFYSKNNGKTWNSLNMGLNSSAAKSISSFTKRGNRIFVGTYGAGIFYQDLSNLSSWQSFNDGLFWNVTYTINTIYNSEGTLISGGGSSASLQLNEINSSKWIQIDFAPFNQLGTALLAVYNSNNILVGGFSQGIVTSKDSGKTWNVYNGISGNYERSRILEYENKLVLMLSRAGFAKFYYKESSNENWEFITQFNNNFCYDFTIKDNRFFAAALDGIYSTDFTTHFNDNIIPNKIILKQNYPNPFNPSTKIEFSVPSENHVSLKVYDLLGNQIANLIDEYKSIGTYTIKFDGENLSSGVYFYQLKIGGNILTKKMNIIK